MKAAYYDRTGPAREVLTVGELPTPMPGAGEVRVKIEWSGVNPSDVKSRAGLRSKTLAFPRIVPHSDGAGVIEEVGPDVPRSRIGERVWTWNAAWGRAFGTCAEYVVLPAHQAVPLPANVESEAGACLGIPALTAYHAVAVNGGVAGKSVLIAGGAGAVGHYAIQMARLMGARQVIATVSGPEKAALAKSAGADAALNYRTDDLGARVHELTSGEGIDRIIEVDLAANLANDCALLRPDGELVVYGSGKPEIPVPFFPMIVKNIGVKFFIVYNLERETRRRAIAHLTSMLEHGRLQHNIAARVPLAKIADAHELVEQGRAIGNVVVGIG